MSKTTEKFIDTDESVFDFGNEFLVVCPKCSLMAKVILKRENADFEIFSYRKIVCLNCGLSKDWNGSGIIGFHSGKVPEKSSSRKWIAIGGNFDWYFQEPLWLQINCCGETLWAYNFKHLEFIENYVTARLRRRIPNQNQSLASRLPKWIKNAKNREEIIKAIAKLKEKLNGKS